MSELVFNTLMSSMAIVSWCLGLRTAMDDGMLLSSWREKAYKWSSGAKEIKMQKLRSDIITAAYTHKDTTKLARELNSLEKLSWKELVAKPTVTCVVCMASAHGIFVHAICFFLFPGKLSGEYFFTALLSILLAAYLNGIGWLLYQKLKK